MRTNCKHEETPNVLVLIETSTFLVLVETLTPFLLFVVAHRLGLAVHDSVVHDCVLEHIVETICG